MYQTIVAWLSASRSRSAASAVATSCVYQRAGVAAGELPEIHNAVDVALTVRKSDTLVTRSSSALFNDLGR